MSNVITLHDHPMSLDSELGRELVVDFARFAEGLMDEAAIRKKFRFDDEIWEKLGDDEVLIKAVETERTRRIRDGSVKKEKAQRLIVQGTDVLGTIMNDPAASPRHRVDAIKTLDSFTGSGPENAAATSDRFIITINLGDETLRFNKSIAPDANDVDPYNDIDIDTTPQELLPAIAAKKGNGDGGQGYL